MPEDLPIACTLTAAELPARLEQMAALGRDGLVDSHTDGTSAQLRFAARPGVRERVEAIVAAESQCCAFLTMRITDGPGTVLLSIDGPEGAGVILAQLVDAFTAAA